MIFIKKICRRTLSSVKSICSTAAVRFDERDPNHKKGIGVKTKSATSESEVPTFERKKQKLYTSRHVSEADKLKVKEKLNELLKDMHTNQSKTSEEKTVKITQAQTKRDLERHLRNKEMGKQLPKYKKSEYEKKLIKSITSVADEFGGNVGETQTDLLESVKKFDVLKEKKSSEPVKKQTQKSKVGRTPEKHVALEMENILQSITNIDLTKKSEYDLTEITKFSEGLGIFVKQKPETAVKLKIWDKLEEEELKFMATTPPRNYFEEMILWTDQGKIWLFPIDNDQGMDQEAEVDFTQHIFLDEYLEPWCPKRGPLRHFMELVLVGLSKNPYLTVQDKKEHIYWYRDYFDKKKKFLQDLGAFAHTKEIGEHKEN